MSKGIKDPLFVGVILLQLAIFSLMGADKRSDNLSVTQLQNAVSSAPIKVGSKLPNFPAYNVSGRRQPAFTGEQPATLIFKTDCTCDSIIVGRWIEGAKRRDEDIAVVVMASPKDLVRIQRANNLPRHILAMRSSDLATLGLLDRLPTAVHVSSNGMIIAVER